MANETLESAELSCKSFMQQHHGFYIASPKCHGFTHSIETQGIRVIIFIIYLGAIKITLAFYDHCSELFPEKNNCRLL